VAVYQPGTRTTGIGWAGATGRFGSIVGLAVPGLLGLSLSGQGIIRPAAVSALVAALCAVVLTGRSRTRTRISQPAAEEPFRQATAPTQR
jgi:nitrate/nitrite transporter NarK